LLFQTKIPTLSSRRIIDVNGNTLVPMITQIYGRIVVLIVPGADDIQLYQPTHKLAYNL
jgi:hypothetical protein